MQLIEQYLYAVTRCLPANQRAEVADELRATIDDMAAGRAKGKKPSQADIEAVLLELGDPELLAAEYGQTRRYLIGPKWYDMYMHLLKQLLLYIPGIVAIIILVIGTISEGGFGKAIGDAISGAITTAAHIFAWTTLGFVIAERSGANPRELSGKKPSWTPADLPEIPHKRQVSVPESAIGLGLALFSIVLLCIGFWAAPWSDSGIPVLHPDLWNPWGMAALALFIASAVRELYKLKVGNWTYGLTVSNVVLNILFAALISYVLLTQDVLNPAFIADLGHTLSDAELKEATLWGGAFFAIATVISCAMDSIDSIRKARALKQT